MAILVDHFFALRIRRHLVKILMLGFGAVMQLAFGRQNLNIHWLFNPISIPSTLAYSPNGQILAVGGIGGVQLYKVSPSQPYRGINTSATGGVQTVFFTPDSRFLIVGGVSTSLEGVLEVWDLANGTRRYSLQTAANTVYATVLTPNGRSLIAAGSGATGVLEIWDFATGKLTKRLPTSLTTVRSIAVSSDSRSLVAGGITSEWGAVENWDLGTFTRHWDKNVVSYDVASVAISPDDKTIGLGGLETLSTGLVQLWSLATGDVVSELPTTCTQVNAVAFAKDGKTFVDAGGGANGQFGPSGQMEIWNLGSDSLVQSVSSQTDMPVAGIAFSPDGSTLADCSASEDYHGNINGVVQFEYTYPSGAIQGNSITQLGSQKPSFSPDGTELVASSDPFASWGLPVWSVSGGEVKSVWQFALNSLYAVDYLASISRVVAAGYQLGGPSQSGTAELLVGNPQSTHSMTALPTSIVTFTAFCVAPNGKQFAVSGDDSGGNAVVEVWNATTARLIRKLSTTLNAVLSAAFSPDSKTLALSGTVAANTETDTAGALELWTIPSGTLSRKVQNGSSALSAVAFSPDGKVLVDGGYSYQTGGWISTLEVRKPTSGALVGLLPISSNAWWVNCVAFSRDSAKLFAGATDGLHVFSVPGQSQLGVFAGSAVQSISTSPTEGLIAFETLTGQLTVASNPTFPTVITNLSLSVATLLPSQTGTGTVWLNQPAPSSGALVHLSSSVSGVKVPASVRVPAGAVSATFKVSAGPAATSGQATVTATEGGVTLTAQVSVN